MTDEFVQRCLSTADVCLSPDPLNPVNDVSTMNKVVEYMAMGRPMVSFELTEARVSAGSAAVYVRPNDDLAFARAIDELLNDPARRRQMGDVGYRRLTEELSWDVSRRAPRLVLREVARQARSTDDGINKESPCPETTSSHPHSDAGESGPRLGRRDFARMSLALATGIVGSCAARPTAGTPPAVTSAGVRPTSLESFDGDYSTGDFSQWWVQCKGQRRGQRVPGFVFGRRRAGRPDRSRGPVRGPYRRRGTVRRR